MRIEPLHDWNLTPAAAIALQRVLADRVIHSPLPPAAIRAVAGADLSYRRGDREAFAGLAILSFPALEIIETAVVAQPVTFPYVPGLLSFRELPPLLAAWAKLATIPDVVLCDGQGLAHPRRFGLACHLGLWLDRPTIGCAKSVLCGEYREPPARRGSSAPLQWRGETIGGALRTKDRVKPVIVSVGHRVTLPDAAALVLACGKGYRVPEPIRQAHLLVNRARVAARSGDQGSGARPRRCSSV